MRNKLLDQLKRKFQGAFGKQVCRFCKRRTNEVQKYEDETGTPIAVCFVCVPYAERRGFPKR